MKNEPSLKLAKLSLICSALSLTIIGQILALIGIYRWYPKGSTGRIISFVSFCFATLASIFYYAILPEATNFAMNNFLHLLLRLYDRSDAIEAFLRI